MQELDEVAVRIEEMLEDRALYGRLAEGSVAQAGRYSLQSMVDSLQTLISHR